jgi:hypothetical protein
MTFAATSQRPNSQPLAQLTGSQAQPGVEKMQPIGAEAHMTDEQREQAAYRAGVALNAWYSQYQQTGNEAFLDNAYHALGLMRKLLAGRSPEYVARLERERNLA